MLYSWACDSALTYQISSKSGHTLRNYDVLCIFNMVAMQRCPRSPVARPLVTFVFLAIWLEIAYSTPILGSFSQMPSLIVLTTKGLFVHGNTSFEP